MTITASRRAGTTLYHASTPREAALIVSTFGMRHLAHTDHTFVTEDYSTACSAHPVWEPRPTMNARLRNRTTA